MQKPVSSFDGLFELEAAGVDRYRAVLTGFGGLTLGCATHSAALTCPERSIHSLSMCFLRPVAPGSEVEFAVERSADGRRFARRRVVGRAGGREVCDLVASFASSNVGTDIAGERSLAEVPDPDSLPTDLEVARAEGWSHEEPDEFEWRWVGRPWDPKPGESSRYRAWVRPRLELPPRPELFAATIAFLADYHSHWPAARKIAGIFDSDRYTSLDQSVWIHRNVDWTDFLFIESELEAVQGGRALARRSLYTKEGERVATMMQEALVPSPPG